MTSGSNERMDRVEATLDRMAILLAQESERQSVFERQFGANLDRVNTLLVDTAERQSVSEHRIDKILAAVEADGEHIRALVRIAEAHQRRIEDLEQGEA